MIGGMVSSTILTLVVIPAIYAAVKGIGLPEARSRATPRDPPVNSRRRHDVEVPEGAK
jgi:Cu(I)/Ag(I) efflux system membrane protein CusA/SilA